MDDPGPRTRVLRADRVLTPHEVRTPGWVLVEGERIVEVTDRRPGGAAVEDLGRVTLVPGFVDLHCHGGGGRSFTGGDEAARVVLATHRRHGTTSTMASLVTDSADRLERQVRDLAALVAHDELVGVHLEGPWLSDLHAGAHARALLRDPDVGEAARLLDAAPGVVRMVTLATERPGGLRLVALLRERGVLVALGHTDATYAHTHEALDAGVTVATHLFNAERGLHHREPGPVLALLERPEVVVELIADGVHVHPALLRETFRRVGERVVLVTDAMAAAGSGDGAYDLGPTRVEVAGGVARAGAGGPLAGSVLTLDQALAHVVEEVGVGLPEAVRALTSTPARVLGRPDLGVLAPGAYADLVTLDEQLRVGSVMRRGRWLAGPS